MFRIISISFIHITDTQQNITLKFGKAVTRNTVLIGVVATVELRAAQQLQWQQIYTTISGCLRSVTEMEHELLPTDSVKILFMNHHKMWDITKWNNLIHSHEETEHLHNALSSCCCSRLVSINVVQHSDDSVNSVQFLQWNSNLCQNFPLSLKLLGVFKAQIYWISK